MGVLPVNKSMSLFINKLFDYAGLFPPAKCPLDVALQKFSEYQSHAQHAALGKFIFPIDKTAELIDFLSARKGFFAFFPAGVLPFSVILSRCLPEEDPATALLRDVAHLNQIHSHFANAVHFSSFEFVPSARLLETGAQSIAHYFQDLMARLNHLSPRCGIFCEVPCEGNASALWIDAVAQARAQAPQGVLLGVKLRTGGVTPPQVPAAKVLAHAIFRCTEHLLPIKLTAGLHVPVPNFNADVGTTMHGFLNVVSAILLGANRKVWNVPFTVEQLETVLTQYSYSDFRFQEDGLHIGPHFVVSPELLAQSKQKYVRGIGSCEFIEPIDHLKQNYK